MTIAYIGRIKEAKGLRVVLQAIARVPAEVPVRLLVAGDSNAA